MLEIENRILRLIANGNPLEQTAEQLCRDMEAILPGVVCTIMRLGPGGLLYPLAAPSLPPEFDVALSAVMIGPDAGSGGTAADLRIPVSVVDIEHDVRWSGHREVALAAGLRSCWSTPILNGQDNPIGALAIYFREPRAPHAREEKLIATCADLCEIALRFHERLIDKERRAYVDGLTGLPNRAAFDAALGRVPDDKPGTWALFVVDLDNLKTVNDTFGHKAGDDLIRAAAERIARAMTPDVAFRLGGDEFAVLIQAPDALEDLDRTAVRLFDRLESVAICDGHAVVPAATIGGAVLSADDANSAAVYQNADFALYHAKETGRGGFVRYWPGIDTRIRRQRDAARDVSEALADGRVHAFYQPVVRLDTREIVGVEALCRIRTASGEIVAASSFQDAVADAKIGVDLTSRMLSIVAEDIRYWLDAGFPCPLVGVNISTADLYAGDLTRKLERSFGRAGLSLEHLALEVNESVYVARRDNVVAREIARLRQDGVRIALDGFGIGYASLTHLIDVPVDAIKIDRTFVARLRPKDPSLAIVRGLLDIAAELDIWVVAEGIETELQARQLCALGCRLGQGFAFSRAVDRDAMTALFAGRTGLPPPPYARAQGRT